MKELKVFNNLFEERNVEAFAIGDEIYFNAQDVGACLEIKDVKSTLRKYKDNQKIILKNSDVHNMHFRNLNNRGELFLTELGLYRMIMTSRTAAAEAFQDWTYNILKQIRQKGYYVSSTITEEQFAELQDEVNYQGQVIRALKGQAKQQGKKIQQQEQQIQKFAAVYNSETAIYTFSNLAAEFGLKTAQNLRCILIAHGVIVRNMINGQAVDEIAPNYQPELIKYKLVHNKRWNYNGDIYQNLQFTEKGRIWLKLRLKEWGNI